MSYEIDKQLALWAHMHMGATNLHLPYPSFIGTYYDSLQTTFTLDGSSVSLTGWTSTGLTLYGSSGSGETFLSPNLLLLDPLDRDGTSSEDRPSSEDFLFPSSESASPSYTQIYLYWYLKRSYCKRRRRRRRRHYTVKENKQLPYRPILTS